ncbi:hypothetical protein O9992_28515 [Vibrio lentus]|nr:hypothetical protein [Vibrio lentus]
MAYDADMRITVVSWRQHNAVKRKKNANPLDKDVQNRVDSGVGYVRDMRPSRKRLVMIA